MAESLLTFAARELLKKVAAILAGEEFSLAWGFKSELATMHATSVKLHAMLQAAEHLTQDQGDDVKMWVKEIEEIAGDADDLLDDFGYEVIRCHVELQDQMKKYVLSIFNHPIVFRHKMGCRITKINESLVNLENQAASFRLVIAGNAACDDPGESMGCFNALKTLHIENAGNLIEWMEVTERVVVFPCLEELTLKSCFRLRTAPSHFPSLKKLVIEAVNSSMPMASILSNKLTTLTHLEICNVRGLTCLPDGMLENNKNLAFLKIECCSEFSCIAHHGFEYCCSSLESLLISWCQRTEVST